MTDQRTEQSTRLDRVPTPRPAPRRRSQLPPEDCGHDAMRKVRHGRAGGVALECRICGAVGVIEP